VANWLRGLGVRRGDHVLLMLGNIVPLWEIMLAAMKRIRRVEFGDLPKTISGKIRRVELRAQETDAREGRGVTEFREEDFTW
jgi:acyl-coenzyme A synthetase/AMP-(fatty) acid ligase